MMMLIGGFAFMPMGASAQDASSEATDDLNLRSDSALNADILDVIPTGGSVEILSGPDGNGFYQVIYNGQTGYAYGYYLTADNVENGPVTTGGDQGEVYVTNGPVYFRSGPSESDPIISVIPNGALVALTGDSANGYLSIIYTDQSGWAYGELVLGTGDGQVDAPAAPAEPEVPVAPETPAEPEAPAALAAVPVGDAVTGNASVVSGRLYLRVGPGLEYEVVTVMPDGAALELRGDVRNGYYPVSFDGTTGWASGDFLQIGGDQAADPSVPEEPAAPAEPSAPQEPSAPENVNPTPTPVPTEEPAAPAPAPTEAPAEPSSPPVDGSDGYTEDEIIQIIYAAADEFGQPREDMLRVARCESVLDPYAVNASSNASGLFQFLPSTWATTPYADQDIFDPVANAEAAAWMWDNGRRNEWTCQ
jgi:uncharacterized protein YraI